MGLGDLIAAEIERRGINQKEAAMEMGVADSPLSKWLRPGSPRPSPESCAKIAQFLRIPTSEVQRLAGYPVVELDGEPAPDPEWDGIERELKEIYESFERSRWRDLLAAHRAVSSLVTPTPKESKPPTAKGRPAKSGLGEPAADTDEECGTFGGANPGLLIAEVA